jgi:hypothetical protein
VLIDGAELRRVIQRHARPIAALLHAAHTIVFDHELLRDAIEERIEFNHHMTALAATGTGGKIIDEERHSTLTVVGTPDSAA